MATDDLLETGQIDSVGPTRSPDPSPSRPTPDHVAFCSPDVPAHAPAGSCP